MTRSATIDSPGLRDRVGSPTLRSAGFAVRRGTPRWAPERQVRLVAGGVVVTSILGSVATPTLTWAAAAIGDGLTGVSQLVGAPAAATTR